MGSIHLFRNMPEIQVYASGDIIFKKGESAEVMYMVIEGDVDLLVGRVVMETAHPGSFIGEMALIDDSPRSASARANGECRVFPIDEARFYKLVQETPSFALDVMKSLAKRLRRTNEKMTSRHAAPRRRAALPAKSAKRPTRRAR
ncbi:MAG: cyclic nucleotide-binding domain-containing protein [Betaproteobacteria bacterium]|nr:cyclic nucleotide-binding domain-containing protein [Betaproteobacteria bacterium]